MTWIEKLLAFDGAALVFLAAFAIGVFIPKGDLVTDLLAAVIATSVYIAIGLFWSEREKPFEGRFP